MDLKSKINLKFLRLMASVRRAWYYTGRSPLTDWRLAIIIFAIIVLILIGFGIYMYFMINTNGFFISPKVNDNSIESLNIDRFSKALEIYRMKKVGFDSILNGGISPQDPSL